MNATRLYLIRHGQVVNHHEYRYNGHHDVDITATGVEQMTRLADLFNGVAASAIYSSDLQRAVKGARIIGERLGLNPVMVRDLREINLGRWDGLTKDEAVKLYPEEADFSFQDLATRRIKGGENVSDLSMRVLPALKSILSRHAGESVIVLAHGGVNRVVLSDAMGLAPDNFFSIEQDYGCLNVIEYFKDGGRVVKLVNGGPNQDLRPTYIY